MAELPETIGSYRVLEALGRGGMGVVYRARGPDGRLVALKTVHMPNAWALSSLRREIHALARIRHPQVVRILDEGVEQGLPWYAMELLEGRSLRSFALGLFAGAAAPQLSAPAGSTVEAEAQPPESSSFPWWTQSLAAGPGKLVPTPSRSLRRPDEATAELRLVRGKSPGGRPDGQPTGDAKPPAAGGRLREVLALVQRLCAPLGFLHGEGIVHRDLKLENILLRAASEQPAPDLLAAPDSPLAASEPVLVDFGLMSRFGGTISREALEVSGESAGTLSTMAPEQILGELVDARADLYALGCTLYELLTGRPPFVGTRGAIVYGHLKERPVPPSQRVADVPPELDTLCLRLLAKSPRERLGHAGDVAAALAQLGVEASFVEAAPRPRPYLYRPGFAGRGDVLGGLEEELGRLEAGAGALVLVGGESGVGKTRLALELGRKAAQRGLLVLSGECLDIGARPLEALRKPLQQIADRCRERGKDETERLLGRRGKVLAQYEPALSELPGQEQVEAQDVAPLSPPAARLRLFSYLADTLAALTGAGPDSEPRSPGAAPRSPLLLILDDLQWADELLLGFLDFVRRRMRLGRWPLLTVGTYRTEEAGDSLLKLLESPGAQRLRLGRLEEAAVAAMVGDMLAIEPPPSIFARYLAVHSEGNPFFVAEYLRMAVAEGLLYRDPAGHWQVQEPVGAQHAAPEATESVYEALPLPGSLRDLVARRLTALEPKARAIVQIASVLGREMDAALLDELTEGGSGSGLEGMNELLRRHVLEEAAQGRLRFSHDKLREVAYEQMDEGLRQELHRAAARAIETRFGGQLDEHLAALGQHWDLAGVPERALECYLGAARNAAARYAHEEAERLYRAYLGLILRPTAESVTARNELARDVLVLRGRNQEAWLEHGRAWDEARLLGDRSAEAASSSGLAEIQLISGQIEESRASYAQALAVYRETGDRSAEGDVLRNLGVLDAEQGRNEAARSSLEQALEIFRSMGNLTQEGRALGNLANICFRQGRLEEASKLYEQALVLLRKTGDRRTTNVLLNNLANTFRSRDRLEEARALTSEALALSRDIGDRPAEGLALESLGATLYDQGLQEEACRHLEAALAIHRESGHLRWEATVLINLSELYRARGELEKAGASCERAREFFRETLDRRREAAALSVLGEIRAEQGRVEEALRNLEQSVELFRDIGDRSWESTTLCAMAGLQRLALGDLDAAEQTARQAESSLRELESLAQVALCLCERGHVALGKGRSGRKLLQAAQRIGSASRLRPQSPLGRAIARLQRAVEASGAGRGLFRGSCIEDIPDGLRLWLAETGHLNRAGSEQSERPEQPR